MFNFFRRLTRSERTPRDPAAHGASNGNGNVSVVNVNVTDSDDEEEGTLGAGGGGGGSTSRTSLSILTSLPRFPKPWSGRTKSDRQQQQPPQQQQQQQPRQCQSVTAASLRQRQTVAAMLNRWTSGGDGGDNQGFPPGYDTRAQAAAVILQEAARLPLTRRHELLDAAAATLPELAPLFKGQSAVPAMAPAPAVDPATGCLLQAPPPPPDLDVKPTELRDKVKKLGKEVKNRPTPAPPAAAAEANPAALRPGEATGDAPAEGGAGSAVEGGAEKDAADALSVSVVPEYEQYGIAAEEVRAVVSLKAISEVPKRAQVALTCVLDRSGSMSGAPIRLVRETCHFLIDQLTEEDYLGLISYSGDVREDLPLLRMTPPARALAHAVVGALCAAGSTALYQGLEAGVRQQMEAEQELRGGKKGGKGGGEEASRVVHSCFLFTDGQATDGPSTPADIISGLQALQAPTGHNVTVHTFGFGSGHSVALLQQVAEAQSGVYYYISCTDDIACGFGDALGGLLAVVATAVRVEVHTRPGVALAAFRSGGRVLHSPASAAFTASTQRITSAGSGRTAQQAAAAVPTGATFNDVFAEETRECLLVLKLPPAAGDAATVSELVEVALQYTDVATGQLVARRAVLRVQRSAADRPVGQLPAEVVFVTAARFETLDAIEAAQHAAETGPPDDVSGAHKVLDEQVKKLTTSPLQVAAVSALVEQTRAARISIKPRMMMDQSSRAAVAGTTQTLKQQRTATSTINSAQLFAQYDYKCKSTVRKTARASISYGARKDGSS